MTLGEKHFHWQWDLRASPEALWPFVADTNRFNRETGIPPLRHYPDREPPSNARQHLGFNMLGVAMEWYEDTFEWVRP